MNGNITPLNYKIDNKKNGQENVYGEDSYGATRDLIEYWRSAEIRKSEYKAELKESEEKVKNWFQEIYNSLKDIKENLHDEDCLKSQKETIVAILSYLWEHYKGIDNIKAKMAMTIKESLRIYKNNLFDDRKVDTVHELINSLSLNLYSEKEFKEDFKKLLEVGLKPISL